MKLKKACLLLAFALAQCAVGQTKSPSEFLGYSLGDRFTYHHDMVDYFRHLDETSDNLQMEEYGRTYENRPLILAYLASDENMARLETIRTDNLKRAGILEGSPSTNVAIVWLSYNVHGNEANSMEAAMNTAHKLLTDPAYSDYLNNTVVIIDPCLNPDGRDRYANFYNQYGSLPYDPDPQTVEHLEPWPGGRQNHYLFDLNRDWAWATQVESRERIVEYNKWLPHVHVDFHEQGYNSPYYFAPAAEPFHEMITPWQREFQTIIGKNNAKYFDQENWFYFTKERFDLLYPSYGDTYPTYNGSIGMTYEQAGHGMGGLGVLTQEGDTLTLLDRLTHHTVAGLATVEVTAQNSAKVLDEFRKFYESPVTGTYKSFVLKAGNPDKMEHLKNWLDLHGIKYGEGGSMKGLKGYHYGSAQERTFSVGNNDLVVNTNQPKGVLAKILFEPKTRLSDSLTYDITAWAVPYFYGLEAYATNVLVPMQTKVSEAFTPNEQSGKPYAYLVEWGSLKDAQFLSQLLQAKVKVRFSMREMTTQGRKFGRGTLVISRRDNENLSGFDDAVVNLANDYERRLYPITTGFMDAGPDVGSGDIRYLKTPKVAMLAGEGTSVTNLGALWYFMEQELQYPTAMLYADGRADLSGYDVLLMQEGWYSGLGEGAMKELNDWVTRGGKLVLFQSAIRKFADSDFASISKYNSEEEKQLMQARDQERAAKEQLAPFADAERNYANNLMPGAVFRVRLDNTHPMAFGYGNTYYTLKTTSARYGYLPNQNVGIIESAGDHLSGFAGRYVREDLPKSLVFGVEDRGRGQIIYFADNTLFRAFWHDGKLLVANSIFFVGQ